MSSEIAKRQILIAVGSLNVPLDRIPSADVIEEACSAAKLLRNRLLREHTRVVERIETLRQQQVFNEVPDADEEVDYDEDLALDRPLAQGNESMARSEFLLICDMMVAEKLIIPLLLAHGMAFSESLLPQLFKLLAAMLLPVPRFSSGEILQKDHLRRIKSRCGTDEFFALLVQCVAPVAEKRTSGDLHREDVVILEVVLTLINYLLDDNFEDSEQIIGAFCRNHGVELLLVVVNQNYSRMQKSLAPPVVPPSSYVAGEDSVSAGEEADKAALDANNSPTALAEVKLETEDVELPDDGDVICLESGDEFSETESQEQMNSKLEEEFEAQVHNLLESKEQLWKWNCLAMHSIASVIRCVPAEEWAALAVASQAGSTSPEQLLKILRNGQHFKICKNEHDNWRKIARSRNGAVTSNGILIRGERGSAVSGKAIGSLSALMGSGRKDPLDVAKDMDLRKRGRFIKGMYQETILRCNLPLPTKIQLAQQNNSFLTFGFEPLSEMVWPRVQDAAAGVERATKEHGEMVAGYKGSGESMEISSPLDSAIYRGFTNVMDYFNICYSLLRYIRVLAESVRHSEPPSSAVPIQQLWQSVSSIISMNHLECGFSVLRSFLSCKDLRKRSNVADVVGYLAEALLMVSMLLDGDIVKDSSVEVAAHALASSILYKEENIRTVFMLLSEYANRNIAVTKAQSCTLFTYAVFQLMEKCSYKGNLLLPKRLTKKRGGGAGTLLVEQEDQLDEDSAVRRHADGDNDSVTSSALEEMEQDMLEDMKDMIDDEVGSATSNERTGHHAPAAEGTIIITPSEGRRSASAPAPEGQEAGEREEEMEDAAEVNAWDDGTGSERAASVASSARTVLSSISSEREVAVSGYIRRLATPKNVNLLLVALRHFRVNPVDVNFGLVFLMNSLIKDGCEGVFFNIAFLLAINEVLSTAAQTHPALYDVCDRIAFDFFNPPYSSYQDQQAAVAYTGEAERSLLSGSQSFTGFEVALRCARSLFAFSATDYTLLEERATPQLRLHTEMPLPTFGGFESSAIPHAVDENYYQPSERPSGAGVLAEHEDTSPSAAREDVPNEERRKRKRRRRDKAERSETKEERRKRKREKKERKERRRVRREEKRRKLEAGEQEGVTSTLPDASSGDENASASSDDDETMYTHDDFDTFTFTSEAPATISTEANQGENLALLE